MKLRRTRPARLIAFDLPAIPHVEFDQDADQGRQRPVVAARLWFLHFRRLRARQCPSQASWDSSRCTR